MTQITRDADVTASLDQVFDLLRTDRRRHLMYYLSTREDKVVDFEAVVDAVCAYAAAGTDGEGFPPRQSVRLDLHHHHIPRLEEAGLIESDSRSDVLRVRGFAELEEWLAHARHMECGDHR